MRTFLITGLVVFSLVGAFICQSASAGGKSPHDIIDIITQISKKESSNSNQLNLVEAMNSKNLLFIATQINSYEGRRLKTHERAFVEELLKSGISPNEQDANFPGYFPLLTAAEQGDFQFVELLLLYGANPEVKHPVSGLTALEIAENATKPEYLGGETVNRLLHSVDTIVDLFLPVLDYIEGYKKVVVIIQSVLDHED